MTCSSGVKNLNKKLSFPAPGGVRSSVTLVRSQSLWLLGHQGLIQGKTLKCYKKYVGVQSWKAMHLPTLDIRVEQKALSKPVSPCWGEVRSDHFRFSSGLSVLSRDQIRSLLDYFRSLHVKERSDPVISGLVPGGMRGP